MAWSKFGLHPGGKARARLSQNPVTNMFEVPMMDASIISGSGVGLEGT